MLIVFEGVDGVGKSTIAKAVRQRFTLNNVLQCSDPCKEHPATNAMRQYVLARGNSLPVEAQVQIFETARLILWHDVISPALQNNTVVLCDRLWLSTWVYQDTKVAPTPEIDLLIYLSDYPENIIKREKISTLEQKTAKSYLTDLDRKYKKCIQEAVDLGAIKKVLKVDASDLNLATEEVVKVIAGLKSGLTIYDRDYSLGAKNLTFCQV